LKYYQDLKRAVPVNLAALDILDARAGIPLKIRGRLADTSVYSMNDSDRVAILRGFIVRVVNTSRALKENDS